MSNLTHTKFNYFVPLLTEAVPTTTGRIAEVNIFVNKIVIVFTLNLTGRVNIKWNAEGK